MAELKDLTNAEALNNQVEKLGDMIELNADYMQDLKRQIKSLPNSNFDDLLHLSNEALGCDMKRCQAAHLAIHGISTEIKQRLNCLCTPLCGGNM